MVYGSVIHVLHKEVTNWPYPLVFSPQQDFSLFHKLDETFPVALGVFAQRLQRYILNMPDG